MDIFDTLIDDHRLIARVLDALEGFIATVEKSGNLDVAELNRFVVFFREFAELTHHEREEGMLFPAMAKLGYALGGAPLAHIRDEHERERHLLFQLRQVAVRQRVTASAKKAHVIGIVRELIAFEREHIQKENELLYPAVKKEFTGKTLDELTRGLWMRTGAKERLIEESWLRTLAEELVREHPSPA
ncbi:MAG TPA: hemerythrin domain-containing protein [Polyangiaceae bacterium]